ncbi:MAG TPA: hypothetical protein VFU49_17540 [Ktedonobacteraceae bacterium]|nr:hypothetical protein [Ktedonobacteraceae bacterium]
MPFFYNAGTALKMVRFRHPYLAGGLLEKPQAMSFWRLDNALLAMRSG